MSASKTYETAERVMRNAISYSGLPIRKGVCLLRVWSYPAFSARVSWSVIQEEQEFFIRRIVWDQNAPTISTYGSEVGMGSELFDSIYSKLQSIKISPFISNNRVGIDGEIYGIEFGNHMTSVSLSWWSHAPQEWAELEFWFKQTVDLFDRALPQYSTH